MKDQGSGVAGVGLGLKKKSRFCFEGEVDGQARGESNGEVRQAQSMVVNFMQRRDIPVSSEVKEHINPCDDVTELEKWALMATESSALEEVFRQ